MSLEELDVIRGWCIAGVILSLVIIGFTSMLLSNSKERIKNVINVFAGIIGGISGLVVFFLFNFVVGWDEYFASKTSSEAIEYTGRHQVTAKVIRSLGEMNISTLGIIFGILGLVMLWFSCISINNLRKIRQGIST